MTHYPTPYRLTVLPLCLLLSFLSGCEVELPSFASSAQQQTFGQSFFTVICQRLAYSESLAAQTDNPTKTLKIDVSGGLMGQACLYGPAVLDPELAARYPKTSTLVANYSVMVDAIDRVFPQGELGDLQDYLISILPLTDDGTLPALIEQVARLMQSIDGDQETFNSLARLAHRKNYRPSAAVWGMMRELIQYPQLHQLLNTLMGVVAEGEKGHQPLIDVIDALSFELRSYRGGEEAFDSQATTSSRAASAPEQTLGLALELLFTADPAFKIESSGADDPYLIVRRDRRGMALVRGEELDNRLPPPFVDHDQDGLADIYPTGEFITPRDRPAPLPFYYHSSEADSAADRDEQGRALDPHGNPVYQYLDLEATLLSALARDSRQLMDPEQRIGLKLLLGAGGLLGDRRQTVKQAEAGESITFQGFDTTQSPIIDLVYGALQLLGDENIDATLTSLWRMLGEAEGQLTRLVAMALDVYQRSQKEVYQSAQLVEQSTLFDDLVEVLQRLAAKDDGALLVDVMRAFGDAGTQNLGVIFANYARFKDLHVIDEAKPELPPANLLSPSGSRVGNPLTVSPPYFDEEVDRTGADSGTNRSILQRILHIINNTNGMRLCNKEGAAFTLDLSREFPMFQEPFRLEGFKECELFQVDNGALFYLQSLARIRYDNPDPTAAEKTLKGPKAHLTLKIDNVAAKLWKKMFPSNPNPPSPGLSTTLSKFSDYYVDQILTQSQIAGLGSHPTTEGLNRLLFMKQRPVVLADLIPSLIDTQGLQIDRDHQGSLVSFEVALPCADASAGDHCRFIEAIQPLVQAFADHDAEQLFLDLIAVLHRHWPSLRSQDHQFADPQKPNYVAGSTLVSYEPLLAEVLEFSDAIPALQALSPALEAITLENGQTATQALVQALGFIIAPSPALTYRPYPASRLPSSTPKPGPAGNDRQRLTVACGIIAGQAVFCRERDACLDSSENRCGRAYSLKADGSSLVQGGVSPVYLLADALDALEQRRDRLAASTTDRSLAAHWDTATSALDDLYLQVDGRGSLTRFSNPRLIPAARIMVDFLRQRVNAHRQAKDLTRWLTVDLVTDLEQILAGPVVSNTVDFLRILEESYPAAAADLFQLVNTLLEDLDPDRFRALLTSVADLAQALLDDRNPVNILNTLGKVLDPRQGLTQVALRFLRPALSQDRQGILVRTLRHAFEEQAPGATPWQTLLDLVVDVHRRHPIQQESCSGADYREVGRQVRAFLDDQQRGLAKFFEVVKNRCGGGPCSAAK